MIIESGIIIFVGLLLLFIKLPPRKSLWLLGHPLGLDLTVSVLAYILHWGTFTGVMAAAVAGLMCSGFTMLGRKLVGYIERDKPTGFLVYRPGLFRLDIGINLYEPGTRKQQRYT